MERLIENYMGLSLTEAMVSKAVGVPPLAEMSRIEQRLFELLYVIWDKKAIKAKKSAIVQAKKSLDGKSISDAVSKAMKEWSDELSPIYGAELRNVYRLGRIAAWEVLTGQSKTDLTYNGPPMEVVTKAKRKKPKLNPTFSLKDKKAAEALVKHQLYWMGNFYDEAVSEAVARVSKEVVVESGGNYKKAADLLDEKLDKELSHVTIPPGYIGTVESYLRGVVAVAITNARVVGQLNSFVEVGVEEYRINAIGDSRTCERCAQMDGKTFKTSQGTKQSDSVLAEKTPEGIKKVHPWLSYSEILSISPNSGKQNAKDSDKLAKAGQALPPFHFKCRCTIDVSYESYTYKP